MIKKNPLVVTLFSFLLLYMAYKVISFFILDSQITHDNTKPQIKLSQFITISEERVKYSQNFYINKDFIGFNAFIDKKYFITVTKLGKISKGYKIIKSDKKPSNSTSINPFDPSDVEDENSRYIDLHRYPFDNRLIYYYSDDSVLNINHSKFYEIETVFSFFNISFNIDNRSDFGYGGFKKMKSISFIEYRGDLFVLNLFPIGNNQYKSLHDLLKNDTAGARILSCTN
jgi:hypothetical protein